MLQGYFLNAAYGRKYKDMEAMLKDFNDGKDFMLMPSRKYCSRRDFEYLNPLDYVVLVDGSIQRTVRKFNGTFQFQD